jgi:DNA-binding NtrC family response regulator
MSSLRVLIAEDDNVIRSLIAELLTAEGMEVVEASSGDEALGCLASGGFGLVITDVVMPTPYGVQVAAMARSVGEGVPMLVITAHRDQWIIDSVKKLARAELLHKPFSADDLMRSVHALLAECAAPQEAQS